MTERMQNAEGRRQKEKQNRLILFFLACAFCILHSENAGAAEDPGSAADVQDVLFLHEQRPLLIRLHIRVDGVPYPERWKEHLTRWFRFLDRNEDGFLDRREAERAPNVVALELMMSNPASFQFLNPPDFDELDRDHDKRVSLEEFVRFYRSSSAGPVRLGPMSNQVPATNQPNSLTDTLFKLLDSDKDGKLSRKELADAARILRKFDQDDDELVSVQELQSTVPAPAPGPAVAPVRPAAPAPQKPSVPLMLVPRETAPRRLDARLPIAREVMKRYDKNDNKHLSRSEIGMPREIFDRLDVNRDGELDTFELLRWILVTPDAEVMLRLGRVEDKYDVMETVGAKNPALEKKAAHAVMYAAGEHCVYVVAAPNPTMQNSPQMNQGLIQQFRNIDQKNKGFLTRKQVEMSNPLRSILEVADTNLDDCLDLAELNAWIDLTNSGFHRQISVALAGDGRSLFSFLDADQDRRLSLRELANPWLRLAPYDRDDDGALSRVEVPLQYQIVVNVGAPNFAAVQPNSNPGQTGSMSRRGPTWFRKMDRNGDGDVSRREFLGSPADFRRLDKDGDGLISLEEARQADEAMRKK